MMDSKIRLDQMIRKLKEGNCRITPQRIGILKILAGSTDHPAVEHICRQVKVNFPTTSTATVYKTIVVLKELGEVLEISFGDGSNRYDGNNPGPPPHLICTECRKIIDVQLDTLNIGTKELTGKTDFNITGHRLDFFGICPSCQ